MYHAISHHSGNSPEFWEENWAASQFEDSLRFCVVDPLRPLFEKYSREGCVMLEGGCGLGQYLAYYKSKGRRVVGLDFAQQALKSLQLRQPDLNLCAGNVSELPFADETFDLYYSGGVVEHFEGGAEKALQEARRVLKKTGVLLISVPYYSPLRKVLLPFRNGEWRSVDYSQIGNEASSNGQRFFQYAYTRREFKKILENADLQMIDTQGYAILWGLSDIPFLNSSRKKESSTQTTKLDRKTPAKSDVDQLIQDVNLSLIKRLSVTEDASVPVLGLGVSFLRWTAANMMMYVCKRSDSNR